MVRRDQVRDAMRDGLGFTAARTRQDQNRSFGRSDSFTLLGIQTREEVH